MSHFKIAILLLSLPMDILHLMGHYLCLERLRLHTNVMKGTTWLERKNSLALLQTGHLQPLNVKVTPALSSALCVWELS